MRIKGTSESELGKSNYDMTITKDITEADAFSVLKNTNVTESGDKLRFTIPKIKTGGLCIEADSTLDAKTINKVVEEGTGGVYKSLAENIESTKRTIIGIGE